MKNLLRPVLCAACIAMHMVPALAVEEDAVPGRSSGGLPFVFAPADADDRVAIAFSFRGGLAHDGLEGPQTSYVASRMMFELEGDAETDEMIETLNDLDGGIAFHPALEHHLGLILAPKSTIADVAEMAGTLLSKPPFPPRQLRRTADDIARVAGAWGRQAESVTAKALLERLVLPHPLTVNYIADSARIRAIWRLHLLSWHRNRIVRDGLVIAVVGNITTERAGALVDAAFLGLPETGDLPELPPLAPKPLAAEPVTLQIREMGQVRVLTGAQIPNAREPERWIAMVMLSDILTGGLNSRLHFRVRAETAATYGFQSTLVHTEAAGLVSIVGTVDPDRKDTAVEALGRALDEFRRNGPTKAEIDDARARKRALYAKGARDHATLASDLRNYALYGWDVPTINRIPELIRTVDLGDPGYRRALLPSQMATVIAEPEAPMQDPS